MESKGKRTPRTAVPAEPAAPHRTERPEPAPVDVPAADVVVERIEAQPPILDTTTEPAAPPPAKPSGTAEKGRDFFELMTESRSAMIRAFASLSDEFASLTQRNSGFARTSLDHWLGSTAKVSELGVKFAIESSKPFVLKFTKVLGEARPGG
jgi:hypothetical protein